MWRGWGNFLPIAQLWSIAKIFGVRSRLRLIGRSNMDGDDGGGSGSLVRDQLISLTGTAVIARFVGAMIDDGGDYRLFEW